MGGFRQVEPALPAAPYIGGKRNLAKRLVDRIQAQPHRTYVDVFGGMGGVFLRRDLAPPAEVFNDKSGDVANLFRILQRHYTEFTGMIRWRLTTRADFDRLAKTDPETLTDLERAARFLYLQRTAFGGKVSGRTFGVSNERPARFDVNRLSETLEDLHARLSGVVIECLDYADLIPRYDRPTTLFYLDPPYYGSEGDYGHALFGRADFETLADCLAKVRGRFILSLNDHPEVRRIFAGFAIEAVETTYTIAKDRKGKTAAAELIVTGGRAWS